MPTDTEPDDSEIVVREVGAAFAVTDQRSAAWLVRKIVEERAYRQRVAEWCAAETLRSERREQHLLFRYGGQLEAWVRGELEKQHGRRRSVHLPSGVVGYRTAPSRVVVNDEKALIGWCRVHLPAAVRTVESILKTEVSAYIKQSGEMPPGSELTGYTQTFYIK